MSTQIITIVFSVLALVAIGYLIMSYNSGSTMPNRQMQQHPMMMGVENFENQAPANMVSMGSRIRDNFANTQQVDASESMGFNERPQGLQQVDDGTGTQMSQLPAECRPKDVLMSSELLPQDANSQWAQINPSGQGSLADQNFLTSGFHIGINTVGQTLRNANRQLRSEPLNPQVKVSPWQQTTIEPDINRRPLEIAACDL